LSAAAKPAPSRRHHSFPAQVLVRLVACYVTWHMQHKLAPTLFEDDNDSVVARAPGPA
jgi:hypothetical protein